MTGERKRPDGSMARMQTRRRKSPIPASVLRVFFIRNVTIKVSGSPESMKCVIDPGSPLRKHRSGAEENLLSNCLSRPDAPNAVCPCEFDFFFPSPSFMPHSSQDYNRGKFNTTMRTKRIILNSKAAPGAPNWSHLAVK